MSDMSLLPAIHPLENVSGKKIAIKSVSIFVATNKDKS